MAKSSARAPTKTTGEFSKLSVMKLNISYAFNGCKLLWDSHLYFGNDLVMVVFGYAEDKELGKALEGSDVIILVCVPSKPSMTHDDLFNINVGIVKNLCTAVAKYCPNALVNMINNLVNSIVPIASEVFKKAGTYDPKRLFGVTTLDVVRAKTFYATKVCLPVEGMYGAINVAC
ncbi:unnamed protein product [Amaranthus hypochondriacus]